jgi:LytS/YehU family sensor histidine kinase
MEWLVPPLMIQTLVENGIKHGISKLKQGGMIHVKTFVQNNRLHVHIRNSGQLISADKKESRGLGIENTEKRLHLIYGPQASFKISMESENLVLTELEIPLIR